MPQYQPDPRYFDVGGAFMGGLQNAAENKRRDALTQIEQGQYGLQERRQGLMEDQYVRGLQADQAAAAQQQVSREALAEFFKSHGFPESFADVPEGLEIYKMEMEKQKPGKLVEDRSGRLVPEAPGVQPYHPPNQGVTGGDRKAFAQWYLSQPPETRDEIDRMNRGYGNPEDLATNARAREGGKGEGTRSNTYIDDGLHSADSMAVVNRGLELLNEVKTGGLDAVKLKATNFFGVTGADEAELSANLGKAVLGQLRATFGAQFTEKEGGRLAEIEAGFGKSTEGNKRLLNQAKQILDRSARRGLDAAEKAGDTFSAEEIRKSMGMKLTANSQPSRPGQSSGKKLSPQEAANLPPGTRFVGLDGVERVKH